MRIMITGAGGFVGAALAANALSAGHEVVALVRPGGRKHRFAEGSAVTTSVDLSDRPSLSAVMRAHRPDVVVHAAWSGVSNAAKHEPVHLTDNVLLSLSVVNAAVSAGVSKFIGIGSQAEYGPLSGRTSETTPPAPTTLYGAAKVATQVMANQLCAEAGLDFAWLRLFSTYGPYDNPHWLIPTIIEQMLDGKRPKTTEGRQLWDYLFIDDVADAICAIAESKAAVGILNLGSGRPIAVRSIVEQIRDIAAPGLQLVFGEIPYKADQIWHMEADIDRLKRLSGFAPKVGLGDGLARTIAWHRSMRREQSC